MSRGDLMPERGKISVGLGTLVLWNFSALCFLFFSPGGFAAAEVSLRIRETDPQFYSGSSVEFTLELSGLPPEGEAATAWKLMLGAAVVGEGNAKAVRGEEGMGIVKVRLDFPAVSRAVEVDWAVRVFADGEPVAEAVFPFRVYPRDLGDRLRVILSPRRPGVFDPGGRLSGLLSSLGVEFTALPTGLALRAFRGEVLLVGPGAFSSPRESFFSFLESTGVRSVLVLDQSVFPGDLPGELVLAEPLPAPGAVSVGLEASDIPPAAPGTRPLVKPGQGSYRSLIDPIAGLNSNGAPLSLVLEYLPGERRIIFCQLPLLDSVGRDPAADLLLDNLVRVLVAPSEESVPVFVIGGGGGGEGEFCRELGLPEPRLTLPPGSFRRAVVFAGRETRESFSGREDELVSALKGMVADGGRVVLIGLVPETLSFWRPLLPEGLELEEYLPGAVSPPAGPLFRGVSPDQWGECLKKAEEAGIEMYRIRGEELRPVAPPLVGKADLGAGAVVICQYPFPRIFREPAAASAAAQFLTNLGLARRAGADGENGSN